MTVVEEQFDLSGRRKYVPQQPSKWQQRIDNAFGFFSPRKQLERIVDREKVNYFRYMAAQPSSARRNSLPTAAGEWLRIQREKMQVMWNAIDMVENSGLCSGILMKFPLYTCGTLRWQAKTGDKSVNKIYQDYIKEKTCKPGNIDLTRRHTLRQQCMLDVKSIMLKGDVGTNIVREDDELYLQGIESNRIGDPYRWITSDTYVRGLNLDRVGRIKSVRIYHQDRRSGYYVFDDTFPMLDEKGLPKFLFFTNPISFDDYRGVSSFKHAIDNDTYITRMREYELQALLWAASQSGVYYTKSGALPLQLPFSSTPPMDKDGNIYNTYHVEPNTIAALSADGEKVEMFQHERPSPNVIGMYENTVLDICNGIGVTLSFGYNMAGMTGPAVRMCSSQDARAIMMWQQMLREQKLDPVVMLLLGDGIAKGDIPYNDQWLCWDWLFPAKTTIDAGRESAADVEELVTVLNTGANIVGDAGRGDIDDIITQRSQEIEMMIEAAQTVAQRINVPWEQIYTLMNPPPRGRGQGGAAMSAAGMAGGMLERKSQGATDDGADLGSDGAEGGNGQSLSFNGDSPIKIHLFGAKKKRTGSLYIVRHGKTKFNIGNKPLDEGDGHSAERIRGHIDVPLTATGKKQAARAGDILCKQKLETIYTSDLQRASDTADIISHACAETQSPKPHVIPLHSLRPWKLGHTIEGKLASDVHHRIKHYVYHPDEKPPGESETFNDFSNRFLAAFNRINNDNRDNNIAIVTHYRGIKLLDASEHGTKPIDLSKFTSKETAVDTGGVYKYDEGGDHSILHPGGGKELHEFYNPDQLRDQGGRFADEGKGADDPGYKHPDEARLTGLDKRLIDYHAETRPLTRAAPDVRSITDYIPGMHYVMYSKTPFFAQLNKLQGTPDPDKINIRDFAAARKKLFKEQPTEKLKISDLIATQPVVNDDKVNRNVRDKTHQKKIAVVRYGGKLFVMDGHHALAAAAKEGDNKIKARVLDISDKQEFYDPGQTRDDKGRFDDEGKGSQEPGYKHPGESAQQRLPGFTESAKQSLESSDVTDEGHSIGHANEAMIVTLKNGQKGVFKPLSGEDHKLYQSVKGNYYQREAAASDIADLLGMSDLVPPTVTREIGSHGIGSLQAFVNGDDAQYHDKPEKFDGEKDLGRAAAFDYLIGNVDRNGSNWMIKRGSRLSEEVRGYPAKHSGWVDEEGKHYSDDEARKALNGDEPFEGIRLHGGRLALIDNGLSLPDKENMFQVNSQLLEEAANRPIQIPNEVNSWREKGPEIAQVLRHREFSGAEIKGVQDRLARLEGLVSFDQLKRKEEDEAGESSDARLSTSSTPTAELNERVDKWLKPIKGSLPFRDQVNNVLDAAEDERGANIAGIPIVREDRGQITSLKDLYERLVNLGGADAAQKAFLDAKVTIPGI